MRLRPFLHLESMGVLSTHCVLHNTGLHIIVEEWEGDIQSGIHHALRRVAEEKESE